MYLLKHPNLYANNEDILNLRPRKLNKKAIINYVFQLDFVNRAKSEFDPLGTDHCSISSVLGMVVGRDLKKNKKQSCIRNW